MTELEKRLCIANYLSDKVLDLRTTITMATNFIQANEGFGTKEVQNMRKTKLGAEKEIRYIKRLIRKLRVETWLDETPIEEQVKLKQLMDIE